jgi:TonB family protein
MTNHQKFNIPFPCLENIANMPLNSEGRFCDSCQKTILDFRKLDERLIQETIQRDPSTCGIFNSHQIVSKAKLTSLIWSKIKSFGILIFSLSAFSKTSLAQENDTLQVSTPPNEIKKDDAPFVVGVIMNHQPNYKYGDHQDLVRFLQENINYSTDTTQGQIIVRFFVNSEGKVVSSEIIKSLSENRDQEVLRVINLLEFEPSKEKSISTFQLPILFNNE